MVSANKRVLIIKKKKKKSEGWAIRGCFCMAPKLRMIIRGAIKMQRQICGRDRMWPSKPNIFCLAFYGKLADCWDITFLSRKQLLEA